MNKKIFHFVRVILTPVLVVVNVAKVLVRLAKSRAQVTKAQNAVVYRGGGFGHTVIGPDMLRRAFPSQDNLFLFFHWPAPPSDKRSINDKIGAVWQDTGFQLIHMWDPAPRGHLIWTPKITCIVERSVLWWLKLFRPGLNVMTEPELRKTLPGRSVSTRVDNPHVTDHIPRYMRLLSDTEAPCIRLPQTTRERIEKRLSESSGVGSAAVGLYLRTVGHSTGGLATHREGTSYDDMRPTLRLLADRGYRVLVYGDRPLSPDMVQEFGGRVQDYASCGVDRDEFMIYAATEVMCVIGDCGGGSWLPPINRIPSLQVNLFPFFQGFSQSTLLFRKIFDAEGNPADLKTIFNKLAFDHVCDGYEVTRFDSNEIRDAVEEFLDFVEGGEEPKLTDEVTRVLPDDTWLGNAPMRISPVWLKHRQDLEAATSSAQTYQRN